MDEFERMCKKFEEMDPADYGALITAKSEAVMDALVDFVADGLKGTEIFFDFILCSVAADGNLAKEEYELIEPMLETLYGEKMTFKEASYWFKSMGLNRPSEFKNTVDMLVDILGQLSPKLKEDIVLICMMICAIDGKVTAEERKWIKQLIA